ncbi:hypothetical protein ACJMK2_030937 [Sinanodonta woodiana]|uniref:VWFA domain-containing protein n=1 Tax=Sinanodonta woodiana TaxID=1069815 RepID=A0ABD3WXB3_SINWO
MGELLKFDPYRKNAYSGNVTFDLTTKSLDTTSSSIIASQEEYNPEVSVKKTPSKDWELDVRALISTKKWLHNYGLKKNKLTLLQILPSIGFKLADDYDKAFQKPVASRYGDGLFSQILSPDGKTYNVTCGQEKLRQIRDRLLQAISLYKRRLEWLTTESRRLFGVIEERSITIILDIRNMSPQQFDQYRLALQRVLYEQVSQIAKFNLIRATDEVKKYQEECIPVTHDTIEGAVKWLWELDRLSGVSRTACVEALLKAVDDPHNEAIYLFTEGSAIDGCRELLKEKVLELERKVPVHVVSFNCESSDTVRFLREFAAVTGGKFHVYAVIMEMDCYEGLPVDPRTNRANIVLKRKTFGGVPAGAGMREDVIQLFEEIEEARNALVPIEALMQSMPEPKIVIESDIEPKEIDYERKEQYMSSKHWLEKYGLSAKKLELHDVLGGVAFKHQDGVVDLSIKPPEDTQTDAIQTTKLVNARYCDSFPVVRWKNGQIVHVQVTPEIHRTYEQKMLVALRLFQNRIDWLNQGSRALFGTVIEEQIYILIDTSESMVPSIQYVKDKLFLLMQEQLRHKMKFNLVAFNSKVQVWQNRLVEVNENSLEGAWRWIQNLSCWGSTNTYGAVQQALGDPGTQAVYLLTDGRPDQPPRSIIAQVQMKRNVPVHTISFNCNDQEANQFLNNLAKATGGRYHYFSQKGRNYDNVPESWESEDIKLLKDEIKQGTDNLDRVADLRDECAKLSWNKEIEILKKCSKNHPLPKTDRPSAVPPMDPTDLYRSSSSPLPSRPSSAPPTQHRKTHVATSLELRSSFNSFKPQRPNSARPASARGPIKKPLSAGHTRTSLLRTLNSSGSFQPEEWLLPETRQLFERQAYKQKTLDMTAKKWLSKHGLVAKKLTILDALAPTFIHQKSKYVPILNKHILSKVFDEMLPVAHVSGRQRKYIKLINPNGINLQEYELKVGQAVELYKSRLDNMVWDALPQNVKTEEYDNKGPVSFENNRGFIMKTLEESGWPVKLEDIKLLEEEIERGEKFIQQSKDLRKVADPVIKSDDDLLSVYDDKTSVASSLSARSASQMSAHSPQEKGSRTSSRSSSRSGSKSRSRSRSRSKSSSRSRSKSSSRSRSNSVVNLEAS